MNVIYGYMPSNITITVFQLALIVILYVKHLLVQEPEDGHYKPAETCSLK
jgi:hypothetical protein